MGTPTIKKEETMIKNNFLNYKEKALTKKAQIIITIKVMVKQI